MTHEQRNARILDLMKAYTLKNTASREIARASLIAEGIYTADGELAPEYGGPPKERKQA